MIMTDAVQATPQEDAEPRMGVGLHKAAARAQEIAQETRVPEFLLGLLFIVDRVGVAGRFPVELILLVLVIGVGAFIRPRVAIRGGGLIVLTWVCVILYVVLLSVVNDHPWVQRGGRWILLFAFAMVLAEGRIHWKSIVAGVCFGLVFINTSATFLGIQGEGYVGFLTGFLGDKNVAGLYYATFGIAGVCLYRSRMARLGHVLVFGALLFLTGSRTSTSAYVVGLIWVLVRQRAGIAIRMALGVATFFALQLVESRYARVGVYSDRAGTDWFRAQIDMATTKKLAETPWYGSGLNTAWVDVYGDGSRIMLFHNSYSGMLVEGGYPLAICFLVLLVVVSGRLFARGTSVSSDAVALEAGVVVTLICAWKLGEVFFTVPCFFILGACLNAHGLTDLGRAESSGQMGNQTTSNSHRVSVGGAS